MLANGVLRASMGHKLHVAAFTHRPDGLSFYCGIFCFDLANRTLRTTSHSMVFEATNQPGHPGACFSLYKRRCSKYRSTSLMLQKLRSMPCDLG